MKNLEYGRHAAAHSSDMGWFWGKEQSDSTNDAYSKLDPALRDFLDKESPLKYADTRPQASQSPASSDSPDHGYRSKIGLDSPGLTQDAQNAAPRDRPEVPPESLFQDGRYAHLWKGYRSQAETEAASRSDQDRLAEVVEAYNDRKAAIGRAAIENCVMEQMAEKECFTSGAWSKRMKMCREENRAFNRCYNMQARFLKALGYLSTQHQTAEDEERIQMHADKLYHEMLAREKKIAEAKEAGTEAPVFQPLIQPEQTTQALGENSAWSRARQQAAAQGNKFASLSSYSPERQAEIRERIKNMSEQEKEVELQLIAAENRAQLEYADRIQEKLEDERRSRADRRERGKETVGDSIKRLWGWDREN